MLPAVDIACPYCGEQVWLLVDDSAGDASYVEDCTVCCRPMTVSVHVEEDGGLRVTAAADHEV
jgi:hypothetical protein